MKKLPEYCENILQFLAKHEKNPSEACERFRKELLDESLTAKANPGPAANPSFQHPRPIDVIEGMLMNDSSPSEIQRYLKEKHGYHASLKAIEKYVASKKKANPSGKKFELTEAQIRRILDRLNSGDETMAEIAKTYGVSASTLAKYLKAEIKLDRPTGKKVLGNPEPLDKLHIDDLLKILSMMPLNKLKDKEGVVAYLNKIKRPELATIVENADRHDYKEIVMHHLGCANWGKKNPSDVVLTKLIALASVDNDPETLKYITDEITTEITRTDLPKKKADLENARSIIQTKLNRVSKKNPAEELIELYGEQMTPVERDLLKQAALNIKGNPVKSNFTIAELKRLFNEYDRLAKQYQHNRGGTWATRPWPKKETVDQVSDATPVPVVSIEESKPSESIKSVESVLPAKPQMPRLAAKIFSKRPGRIAVRGKPAHVSSGEDKSRKEQEAFKEGVPPSPPSVVAPTVEQEAEKFLAKEEEVKAEVKAEAKQKRERRKKPRPEVTIETAQAEFAAREDRRDFRLPDENDYDEYMRRLYEVDYSDPLGPTLVKLIRERNETAQRTHSMNYKETSEAWGNFVKHLFQVATETPGLAEHPAFKDRLFNDAKWQRDKAKREHTKLYGKGNPGMEAVFAKHLRNSILDDAQYIKHAKGKIPAKLMQHLMHDMKENYALLKKITVAHNPRRKKSELTPKESAALRAQVIDGLKKSIQRVQVIIEKNQRWLDLPNQPESLRSLIKFTIAKKTQELDRLKRLLSARVNEPGVPMPTGISETELTSGIEYEMQFTGDRELAKKMALTNLAKDKDYYFHKSTTLKLPFGQGNPTQKKFSEIERVYYQRFLNSPLGKSLNNYGYVGENKNYDIVEVNSERRKFFDKIRNFVVDASEAIMRSYEGVRTRRSELTQKELYGLDYTGGERKLSQKVYIKAKEAPETLTASEREALLKEQIRNEQKYNFSSKEEVDGDKLWRNNYVKDKNSASMDKWDEAYISGFEYTSATGSKARKKHERTPGFTDEMHTEKLKKVETLRYQRLTICAVLFGLIEPIFQFKMEDAQALMDALIPAYGVDDYHRYRNMAQTKYRDDFVETVIELARKRETEPYMDQSLNDGNQPKELMPALIELAKAYMKQGSS